MPTSVANFWRRYSKRSLRSHATRTTYRATVWARAGRWCTIFSLSSLTILDVSLASRGLWGKLPGMLNPQCGQNSAIGRSIAWHFGQLLYRTLGVDVVMTRALGRGPAPESHEGVTQQKDLALPN